MSATAKTLKLVQATPKKSSAPRLRAGIIEGTCGEDAGPYPSLPADVQHILNRKARALADEAFDVIRESLVRNVSCHCFYGGRYEEFDAEQALHLIGETSLDSALTPLVRQSLRFALLAAKSAARSANEFQDAMSRQLRQFEDVRDGGNAA